jgi:diaminopimelate decarboxylase
VKKLKRRGDSGKDRFFRRVGLPSQRCIPRNKVRLCERVWPLPRADSCFIFHCASLILSPVHSFRYVKSILHCEGVSLEAVADRLGTPTYVYSADTIRHNYRRLDEAFAELDHLVCYAAKANSNLSILNLLVSEGAGFDIVSGGELFRVLKAGGRADRCTFAGVGKTRDEIAFALEAGVHCFNVESEPELAVINEVAGALGSKAPVAIRVNPDVDAKTHKYISTGRSHNKFGIGIDRAAAVFRSAASLPHLRIRGVQTHIGSQILDAAPFAEAIEKLVPLVEELKASHGIEFFSIGGGIGIIYDPALASGDRSWWTAVDHARRITPADYAAAVVPLLKPLNIRILLEPGRFIVGNSGVLLSSVLYVKETPARTFTVVDAAMNDLIRPALYEGHHEIHPIRRIPATPILMDVVGPVCESGDFFAQDRSIQPLASGDRIALMSAGAYGFVMASNYNSRPLAAEVLVDGNQFDLVRERQAVDDLIRGERIP